MFRTPIELTPSPLKLSFKDRVLTLGSCFADVMGKRLAYNKFKVKTNPFGILYHPSVIAQNLQWALQNETPPHFSYVERDQMVYNYNLHSDIHASDLAGLQQDIGQRFQKIGDHLESLDQLILTFGTAFYFQHKDPNFMVANCHKMPASLFQKQCSTLDELVEPWLQLLPLLPVKQVILTVSPVRHLREGLAQNQLSKSLLRVACHEICSQIPQASYFPAYEMVVDDLRDYRFYEADMIHPSKTAEDYIWQGFIDNYTDTETQQTLIQWGKILKNLEHRPFQEQSSQYRKFLQNTLELIHRLPVEMDTSKETAWLKAQLDE